MLDRSRKTRTQTRHSREELRDYLETILHCDIRLHDWQGTKRLPNFLGHRYRFFEARIVSQSCLFAYSLHSEDDTAAQISKQISGVQRAYAGLVVYVAKSMSASRRSQLVAAGIPFAVPGKQLYVPQLAVDLREVYRAPRPRHSEHLSPVAQATLFFSLLFRDELALNSANRTPSRMARRIGYSSMSIGRAYEELSDYGLTGIDVKGRQKFLVLEEQPRHLLERAQDLLRTPVQSTKLVRCNLKIPPMKIAGESALSNLTELSPPEIPVYALHASEWKAAAGDYIELVTSDDANAIVEVWHYRPDVLTDYATVDPLSLYAQFWNHPNERVAKSAKELLEHVQW